MPGEPLSAATKHAEILDMRIRGMTATAIAYQLQGGMTAGDVNSIIVRAARAARARNEEIVDEQWFFGIARCEALLVEIDRRLKVADDKQAAALIGHSVRVLERLARQLGTDARATDTWLGGKDDKEMEAMAKEFGLEIPKK